jgi:hypothetical protein
LRKTKTYLSFWDRGNCQELLCSVLSSLTRWPHVRDTCLSCGDITLQTMILSGYVTKCFTPYGQVLQVGT